MVFAFVLVSSLALLGGLFFTGRGQKLEARIDSLAGKERPEDKNETVAQMARTALPKMGKIIVPENEAERTKLVARLVHAGLYHRQAMHIFLGVKLTLLAMATVVGIGLTTTNVLPMGKALPIAIALFFAGMIGPSFWLDRRKKARQTTLRRGLPDALDVLIICQEGGLSLQAGLKRVGRRAAVGAPDPRRRAADCRPRDPARQEPRRGLATLRPADRPGGGAQPGLGRRPVRAVRAPAWSRACGPTRRPCGSSGSRRPRRRPRRPRPRSSSRPCCSSSRPSSSSCWPRRSSR